VADTAIALIIAGSGETTEAEVTDLLNDAYPEDQYPEIGVVVPLDKDLHTKSVQNVIAWFNSDADLYTVQTEGASMTRAAARLGQGAQKVEKYTDLFVKSDFAEWDDVHVLLALPEDPEDPDYDKYAEIAEVAIDGGFTVKNLCRGLDDVTLAEAEDEPTPEPEPEPEPEKPARRSRRKPAAEKADEPDPVSVDDDDQAAEAAEPEKPARRSRAKAKAEEPAPEPEKDDEEPKASRIVSVGPQTGADLDNRFAYHPATETTAPKHEAVRAAARAFAESLDELLEGGSREKSLAVTKIEEAMFWANAHIARSGALAGVEEPAAPSSTQAKQTSSRGRGRPRTNFEVPQIWDDEEDEWIPRPKGRMKKGTEWRTIHAESGEVLESGTA
jgi:hypothetical protein